MAELKDVMEKTQELIVAPSCYYELAKKAQTWLKSVDTADEYAAAVDFINELEADIVPIDKLIAMAESANNQQLLEHAKDVKAKGGKYCDCPACSFAAQIIEMKDIVLNNALNAKIIAGLQVIVTQLAQQADGHLIQSRIFASQGLNKLAEKYAEHSEEERGYVIKCIDRIIDLGGEVKLEDKKSAPVCKDAEEFLKYDLQVSKDGLRWLAGIVKLAQDDLTTFEILSEYYKDEESDMYWAQQQLDLIQLIGKQNWLSKQI